MSGATMVLAIDARRAKRGAGEFRGAVQQVKRGAEGAEKGVQKLDKRMAMLGKTGSKVGGIIKTAFAGITAAVFLRNLTKTVADFEQTMSTVRGVTKATAEDFALLSAQARDLGATTRFSAKEAAEGQLFLARAGFETQQVMAALPHTLNLAAAGAMSLGEAADFASNIVSQFNLSAEETVRVADALVIVSNRANTNVTQMAEAMKFAGPVAGALGISVEETAAAIGVLGDRGIQAGLAGTGLRMSMIKLLSPTAAAKKAIKDLGLRVEELNPGTVGVLGAFEKLAQAQRELGDDTRFATQMAEIFGARTAGAALIMVNATERMRHLREETKANAGETADMARIMDDNLAGSLKALKSSWDEILLAMGDKGFKGTMRDIVDTITGALRIMAGMEDKVTKNAVAAKTLVLVLKAIGVILAGVVIIKIGAAILAFGLMTQAIWLSVASLTALKAAFLANPIGWIALGLSALAGTIYVLNDSVDEAAIKQREHTEALKMMREEVDRVTQSVKDFNYHMGEGANAKALAAIRSHITDMEAIIKELHQTKGPLGPGNALFERSMALRDELGAFGSVPGISPDPANPFGLVGSTSGRGLAKDFEDRLRIARTFEVELANAVREGAKAQREMEAAQRARIDLIAGLDKLERDLTTRHEEQNEALARAKIERQGYLDQAEKIAKAQKLDAAQKTILLRIVNDSVDRLHALKTAIDANNEAQRKAEEIQRARAAADNQALETLDSLYTSALRENALLEAQAKGVDVLRESQEAQLAIQHLSIGATGVEIEAMRDLAAAIDWLVGRNNALKKAAEDRKLADAARKSAAESLETHIKQLERENELLTITDEKERQVAASRLMAGDMARAAGLNVEEYADKIEGLVREQQRLQEGTEETSQWATGFANAWTNVTKELITDMDNAADSVWKLIDALGQLVLQELALTPLKGFLQGIAGSLVPGPAKAPVAPVAKPTAAGDVFGQGPYYFNGPKGELRSFAEKGAEAIMPLVRGPGGLGVKAHGGSGKRPVSVVVNVKANDVNSFKASERQVANSIRRGIGR